MHFLISSIIICPWHMYHGILLHVEFTKLKEQYKTYILLIPNIFLQIRAVISDY